MSRAVTSRLETRGRRPSTFDGDSEDGVSRETFVLLPGQSLFRPIQHRRPRGRALKRWAMNWELVDNEQRRDRGSLVAALLLRLQEHHRRWVWTGGHRCVKRVRTNL